MSFEDNIDELLEAMARERPMPSATLVTRILADAERVQTEFMRPAMPARAPWHRRLLSSFGTLRPAFPAAGLATACLALFIVSAPVNESSIALEDLDNFAINLFSDLEENSPSLIPADTNSIEVAENMNLWLTGWHAQSFESAQ